MLTDIELTKATDTRRRGELRRSWAQANRPSSLVRRLTGRRRA